MVTLLGCMWANKGLQVQCACAWLPSTQGVHLLWQLFPAVVIDVISGLVTHPMRGSASSSIL